MSNILKTSSRLLSNPTGAQVTLSSVRSYARDAQEKLSDAQVRHYSDVLGIPYNATETRLKQAFYVKSKLTHPDVNKDPGAEKEFAKISEAYNKLVGHRKVVKEYANRVPYRSNRSTSHFNGWVPPRPEKRKKPTPSDTQYTGTSDEGMDSGGHRPKVTTHASSDYLSKNYVQQLKRDSSIHAARKKASNNKSNNNPPGECCIQ